MNTVKLLGLRLVLRFVKSQDSIVHTLGLKRNLKRIWYAFLMKRTNTRKQNFPKI